MQNFNFSLIPVVGLVVRIVCQLFPSSQPVFGNKRACYKFSANICWTAGQKVGQHGGYLIMLQPQLIAMDRLHCIKEKERERERGGGRRATDFFYDFDLLALDIGGVHRNL